MSDDDDDDDDDDDNAVIADTDSVSFASDDCLHADIQTTNQLNSVPLTSLTPSHTNITMLQL